MYLFNKSGSTGDRVKVAEGGHTGIPTYDVGLLK